MFRLLIFSAIFVEYVCNLMFFPYWHTVSAQSCVRVITAMLLPLTEISKIKSRKWACIHTHRNYKMQTSLSSLFKTGSLSIFRRKNTKFHCKTDYYSSQHTFDNYTWAKNNKNTLCRTWKKDKTYLIFKFHPINTSLRCCAI